MEMKCMQTYRKYGTIEDMWKHVEIYENKKKMDIYIYIYIYVYIYNVEYMETYRSMANIEKYIDYDKNDKYA